ncbi:alpha-mannosidase [Reichenbachiella sp. MALMAid0571]|uniref:alpha-mannosidase n=1 Tax=Reichenbachiella sp. MALMAid0571 TaxID=3143939 RepID=UPI0032DEBB58
MRKHSTLTLSRIEAFLEKLTKAYYKSPVDFKLSYFKSAEPTTFEEQKKATYKPIAVGENWGSNFDCAWFKLTGTIPESFKGHEVVALINLGGEVCIYDHEGKAIQGLTNKRIGNEFDEAEIKRRVYLTDKANGNEEINLLMDAGANNIMGVSELNGVIIADGTVNQAEMAIFDRNKWQLFLDYDLLFKFQALLEEKSRHKKTIIYALNEVINLYGDGSDENVQSCREVLAVELKKRANASAMKVSAIGHAHIDIAWLWPLRETVRKTARSFSTALKMMEEYPEYKFGASQPHLYQMVKDNHPELFERIKEAVKQGRWECQGGMWVEADCNVSGGESLVRQLLYGKKFFKEEFDQDVDNLWLPDVFGYSAALPQMLIKSGINFFMTQKISWNQFNRFPHHTFIWEGLDGTEIFSHFLCNDTYNSNCAPDNIKMFETANQDADRTEHSLLLYGVGDGGGGPDRKHIERLRRMADLEDMPKVEMEFARDFFQKIKATAKDLQKWNGELYLEYHRGTLTTQALVKKKNRKLEILIREVEFLFSMFGMEIYPQDQLERLWKVILLNQFHDIIPGSSINRVYKECHEEYDAARLELLDLLKEGESRLLANAESHDLEGKNGLLVYNSLSWDREEIVEIPEGITKVKVPSLGYAVVHDPVDLFADLSVTDCQLENDLIRVVLNDQGYVESIYDKEFDREILQEGQLANVFKLYEDQPITYEAWDVDIYYEEIPPVLPKLVSKHVMEHGKLRASIAIKFKGEKFELDQIISLSEGSKRIDFHTTVDWNEDQKMLRVDFPVKIKSQQATFEIQYGHVKRNTHSNTSWDMAQFEVVAHKWADLSQPNYGVALINDCKYGHKIKDNIISLNLLRSPKSPDAEADMHVHEFSYALFPHTGDHIEGKVVQEAYQFNFPMRVLPFSGKLGGGDSDYSGIRLSKENVIIESLKKAEYSDSLILRLYESSGIDTDLELTCAENIDKVWITNLMEEDEKVIDVQNDTLKLHFNPFEINTLKLKFK